MLHIIIILKPLLCCLDPISSILSNVHVAMSILINVHVELGVQTLKSDVTPW